MSKIREEIFQEPGASKLAQMRIQSRSRRHKRITYDCMNAIVQGDIVICKKGHVFKRIGGKKAPGLSVLSVLKGISSSVCKSCQDCDEETTE